MRQVEIVLRKMEDWPKLCLLGAPMPQPNTDQVNCAKKAFQSPLDLFNGEESELEKMT